MMLDIQAIRKQFPALMQNQNGTKPVFFDGPGGSQVPQSVLNNIVSYLSSGNANLGGAYFSSKNTDRVMSEARQAAADLYNANSKDEIIFGANATSLAFSMSRVIANTWKKDDEIISTTLDHYSNVSPWQIVAKEKSAVFNQAPMNTQDCSLNEAALLDLITHRTKLIALTHASNISGSIINLGSLIKKIRQKCDALIYVDAVHLVPHQLIDVQALDCDFLVSSAYKYYGPHLGVMFAKQQHQQTLIPYKVEPATNNNPNRWETGTQSFEAMSGYIATIDYLASLSNSSDEVSRRIKLEESFKLIHAWENELGDYFLTRLREYKNIKLYGKETTAGRTPTFAIHIENIESNKVSRFFAEHSICISDGNFYAAGIYQEIGLTEKNGIIRIGLMHYNTKSEIDLFFDLLSKCIHLHDPSIKSEKKLKIH